MTVSSNAMSFDDRVNDLVESIVRQQEDYIEECHEYAKSGHRHNYCFHGVNMWVDYDCACGLCEDGAINEYSSREEIEEYANAIIMAEQAKEQKKELHKRKMIQILMNSEKNYSFSQAEKIYHDLMD